MIISSSIQCPIASDCKAWLEAVVSKSGIYPIKPSSSKLPYKTNLFIQNRLYQFFPIHSIHLV